MILRFHTHARAHTHTIFKIILFFNVEIYFYHFRYPLNVPRDSEKHILSINLISFQTTLALLHKLKIISRDEIDNAFKKNEFLDGSVLRTFWVSIIKMNVIS